MRIVSRRSTILIKRIYFLGGKGGVKHECYTYSYATVTSSLDFTSITRTTYEVLVRW